MAYAPPHDSTQTARSNVSPYLRSLRDGRIYAYTPVLAAREDMHPWWDPPKKLAPRQVPLNAEPPQFAPKPKDALSEAEFRREMQLAQKREPTPEEIFAKMDGKSSGPAGDPYSPPETYAPKPDDAMTEAEFERRMARETAPQMPVEAPPISRTRTPVAGTPEGRKATRKGKATRKQAEADTPPTALQNMTSAPRFNPHAAAQADEPDLDLGLEPVDAQYGDDLPLEDTLE